MSDRRTRVLEAAQELFRQYGPYKTTVGDIARAAGIGVGSVYLEFQNKDEILLALSEARHRAVLDRTANAWTADKTDPPRVRLEQALEARLNAFLAAANTGMHGAQLVHCGGCDPIQRAHATFKRLELELFGAFIAEGMELGAFATRDPLKTARALLTAYSAFSPPRVFMCEAADLRTEIRAVHDLVFNGLLTH